MSDEIMRLVTEVIAKSTVDAGEFTKAGKEVKAFTQEMEKNARAVDKATAGLAAAAEKAKSLSTQTTSIRADHFKAVEDRASSLAKALQAGAVAGDKLRNSVGRPLPTTMMSGVASDANLALRSLESVQKQTVATINTVRASNKELGTFMGGVAGSYSARLAGIWAMQRWGSQAMRAASDIDVLQASIARITAATGAGGGMGGLDRANQLMDEGRKIAYGYNVSLVDVMKTMTELTRRGGDIAANAAFLTKNMAEVRLMLATSSGQFMSMNDIMERTSSLMQQLGISSTEAVQAMRYMAELDIRTASSFDKISKAITRFAATGRVANMSMNDMIEAATAITSAGFSGAEGGTALNTILSRVARNTKALDFMRQYGVTMVSVEDGVSKVNNSLEMLVKTYQILQESGQYMALREFFEMFAGTRMQSKAAAMLDMYVRQRDIVKEIAAANRTGEEAEKARLKMVQDMMNTIVSKREKMRNAFEAAFITSDAIDLMKTGVDVATGVSLAIGSAMTNTIKSVMEGIGAVAMGPIWGRLFGIDTAQAGIYTLGVLLGGFFLGQLPLMVAQGVNAAGMGLVSGLARMLTAYRGSMNSLLNIRNWQIFGGKGEAGFKDTSYTIYDRTKLAAHIKEAGVAIQEGTQRLSTLRAQMAAELGKPLAERVRANMLPLPTPAEITQQTQLVKAAIIAASSELAAIKPHAAPVQAAAAQMVARSFVVDTVTRDALAATTNKIKQAQDYLHSRAKEKTWEGLTVASDMPKLISDMRAQYDAAIKAQQQIKAEAEKRIATAPIKETAAMREQQARIDAAAAANAAILKAEAAKQQAISDGMSRTTLRNRDKAIQAAKEEGEARIAAGARAEAKLAELRAAARAKATAADAAAATKAASTIITLEKAGPVAAVAPLFKEGTDLSALRAAEQLTVFQKTSEQVAAATKGVENLSAKVQALKALPPAELIKQGKVEELARLEGHLRNAEAALARFGAAQQVAFAGLSDVRVTGDLAKTLAPALKEQISLVTQRADAEMKAAAAGVGAAQQELTAAKDSAAAQEARLKLANSLTTALEQQTVAYQNMVKASKAQGIAVPDTSKMVRSLKVLGTMVERANADMLKGIDPSPALMENINKAINMVAKGIKGQGEVIAKAMEDMMQKGVERAKHALSVSFPRMLAKLDAHIAQLKKQLKSMNLHAEIRIGAEKALADAQKLRKEVEGIAAAVKKAGTITRGELVATNREVKNVGKQVRAVSQDTQKSLRDVGNTIMGWGTAIMGGLSKILAVYATLRMLHGLYTSFTSWFGNLHRDAERFREEMERIERVQSQITKMTGMTQEASRTISAAYDTFVTELTKFLNVHIQGPGYRPAMTQLENLEPILRMVFERAANREEMMALSTFRTMMQTTAYGRTFTDSQVEALHKAFSDVFTKFSGRIDATTQGLDAFVVALAKAMTGIDFQDIANSSESAARSIDNLTEVAHVLGIQITNTTDAMAAAAIEMAKEGVSATSPELMRAQEAWLERVIVGMQAVQEPLKDFARGMETLLTEGIVSADALQKMGFTEVMNLMRANLDTTTESWRRIEDHYTRAKQDPSMWKDAEDFSAFLGNILPPILAAGHDLDMLFGDMAKNVLEDLRNAETSAEWAAIFAEAWPESAQAAMNTFLAGSAALATTYGKLIQMAMSHAMSGVGLEGDAALVAMHGDQARTQSAYAAIVREQQGFIASLSAANAAVGDIITSSQEQAKVLAAAAPILNQDRRRVRRQQFDEAARAVDTAESLQKAAVAAEALAKEHLNAVSASKEATALDKLGALEQLETAHANRVAAEEATEAAKANRIVAQAAARREGVPERYITIETPLEGIPGQAPMVRVENAIGEFRDVVTTYLDSAEQHWRDLPKDDPRRIAIDAARQLALAVIREERESLLTKGGTVARRSRYELDAEERKQLAQLTQAERQMVNEGLARATRGRDLERDILQILKQQHEARKAAIDEEFAMRVDAEGRILDMIDRRRTPAHYTAHINELKKYLGELEAVSIKSNQVVQARLEAEMEKVRRDMRIAEFQQIQGQVDIIESLNNLKISEINRELSRFGDMMSATEKSAKHLEIFFLSLETLLERMGESPFFAKYTQMVRNMKAEAANIPAGQRAAWMESNIKTVLEQMEAQLEIERGKLRHIKEEQARARATGDQERINILAGENDATSEHIQLIVRLIELMRQLADANRQAFDPELVRDMNEIIRETLGQAGFGSFASSYNARMNMRHRRGDSAEELGGLLTASLDKLIGTAIPNLIDALKERGIEGREGATRALEALIPSISGLLQEYARGRASEPYHGPALSREAMIAREAEIRAEMQAYVDRLIDVLIDAILAALGDSIPEEKREEIRNNMRARAKEAFAPLVDDMVEGAMQGYIDAMEELIAAIKSGWDEGFNIGFEHGFTPEGFKALKDAMVRKIATAVSNFLRDTFAEAIAEAVAKATEGMSGMMAGFGRMLGQLIGGLIGMVLGFLVGGFFNKLRDQANEMAEQQRKAQRDRVTASGFSWSYRDAERATPYYEYSPPITQESVKIIKFQNTFNITTDAARALMGDRRELQRIIEEIITATNRTMARTVGARV